MAELASSADVEARLGRDLTSEEARRVDGLLEEISVLAVDQVPELASLTAVPKTVAVVLSRAVADALSGRTDGVIAETVGPFGRRFAEAQVVLTEDAVARLQRAIGVQPTGRMRDIEGWD